MVYLCVRPNFDSALGSSGNHSTKAASEQLGVYANDPLFQPQPGFMASPNTQTIYAQQMMAAPKPVVSHLNDDDDDTGYTHYDSRGNVDSSRPKGGDIIY